ncbi:hypothetical protein HG531_004305 [Fusarium graminearum]|nr:hypothetical protein HG531_004305 [Fusarium graminearum]
MHESIPRWHGLALGLVQGGADDLSVGQIDLAVRLLLERECVLHPVLVISVGEILAGVSTTRLLSVGGRLGGLDTIIMSVSKLKSLNEIRVPDHAAVLHANLAVHAIDLLHLADTLVQTLLGSEHADLGLHSLLHGKSDLSSALGAVGGSDLVEGLDVVRSSVSSGGLQSITGVELVANGVRNGTTKDNKIEKRVGTQTVSTVDGHTSGLTTSVQTRNNLVLTLLINVDGGENGNRLLADIDTSENTSGLRDTGQTLSKDLSGEMAELEVDVILLSTNTTALTDLHGHGSGNDITRSKILGGRGISLHESLTLGVEEVTTLTTRTLSDQAASSVDTSRVELDELKILVGETGTGNHGHTVTSTGVGRCAGEVSSAVTTSGEDGVVGEESVQSAVLLVVGEDTAALTILHNQVEGEVLDEVVGLVAERLAVESVKKGVAGSVSGSTASLAGNCSSSREGAAVVLKLDNGSGSLSGHVVNSVLVTQPVGTLDGIVHVPSPVVLVHVT